jgi:hypothetical protein
MFSFISSNKLLIYNMAVNLKLGNNVFSKEKKIVELEKRV